MTILISLFEGFEMFIRAVRACMVGCVRMMLLMSLGKVSHIQIRAHAHTNTLTLLAVLPTELIFIIRFFSSLPLRSVCLFLSFFLHVVGVTLGISIINGLFTCRLHIFAWSLSICLLVCDKVIKTIAHS